LWLLTSLWLLASLRFWLLAVADVLLLLLLASCCCWLLAVVDVPAIDGNKAVPGDPAVTSSLLLLGTLLLQAFLMLLAFPVSPLSFYRCSLPVVAGVLLLLVPAVAGVPAIN
jgi:hypothetical protein